MRSQPCRFCRGSCRPAAFQPIPAYLQRFIISYFEESFSSQRKHSLNHQLTSWNIFILLRHPKVLGSGIFSFLPCRYEKKMGRTVSRILFLPKQAMII